jgi:hypothetical protein
MHGGVNKLINNFSLWPERDHMGDVCADARMILKQILKKQYFSIIGLVQRLSREMRRDA